MGTRSIMTAAMAALAYSRFSSLAGIEPRQRSVRGNRYRPHQGVRECARRVGGTAWLSYRATDRVRRGLPVSWVYRNEGGC